MTGLIVSALYICAGVCLCMGIAYTFIWTRRRKDWVYLAFAGICLIAALSSLADTCIYRAETVDACITAVRWKVMQIWLWWFALAWFAAIYTGFKPIRVLIGMSCLFAVGLAGSAFSPYNATWFNIQRIKHAHLPWSEQITFPKSDYFPWLAVFQLCYVVAILFIFIACYRQYRQGKRVPAILLAAATVVFLAGLAGDIFIHKAVVRIALLGDFACPMMVVILGLSLCPMETNTPNEREKEKWLERMHVGQRKILERLAAGDPLEELLRLVAETAEQLQPQMLCSILLLNEREQRLCHGAGPSLPESYNRAIDGVRIGSEVGSCGTAAHTARRVIVEDIAIHPYWAAYREIALKAGLRACWSEPILSPTGNVLGTLAMYYREPRLPSTEDLDTIESLVHLAGVAIEHQRTQRIWQIQQAQHTWQIQQGRICVNGEWKETSDIAPDLIAIVDRDFRIRRVNQAMADRLGVEPEACIGKTCFHVMHDSTTPPDHCPHFQVLRDGRAHETELHSEALASDLQVTASPLFDSHGTICGSLHVARDIAQREWAETLLRRREAILEAACFTAERFLRGKDWLQDIDAVLSRLGQAADVSRLYVYEHHADRHGELWARRRGEWIAPSVTPSSEQPRGEDVPMFAHGLDEWVRCLERGEPFSFHVREFASEQMAGFILPDSKSFVAVPVFVDDKWWGILGFDESRRERTWESAELDALRMAADALGAAVQRGRSEVALREAHERLSLSNIDLEERVRRRTAELEAANQRLRAEINERQQAEKARRESERSYRKIFNATSEAICVQDARTGQILDVNQPMLDMFDRSREDMLNMTVEDISLGEPHYTQERAMQLMRDAVEKGPQLFEWGSKKRTGEKLWTEVTLRSSRINGHDCVLAVVRDVSERKQAREALRESEERFRMLFEQGPIGVMLVDFDFRIFKANPALCRLLGYTEDELTKMTIVELTHPDDVERGMRLASQILGGEIPDYFLEKRYVKQDGSEVWVQVTASVVHDRDGAVQYGLGMIEDITARKMAAEQFRQLQTELAHVARLSTMGEMATGLAHELNQPLASMHLYAQTCTALIAAGTTDVDELLEPLLEMSVQANRAAEIVRRLRSFVRKRARHRSSVDLNRLVREVVELAAHETRKHDVSLRLELAEGLPLVLADSIQLQQVVLNLTRNAIQALIDAPVREITIRTAAADHESLVISVQDTGPGFSEESPEQAFEPFYTTKPEGMGMGLSISRAIVEDHGGHLCATHGAQGGATFRFTLPVRSGED